MRAEYQQQSTQDSLEFSSKALWADEWRKPLEVGFRNSIGDFDYRMQYQFALLRFLRWHRLEGLFSVGGVRGYGEVADRVIADVANRYIQREKDQALVWEWIGSWATQNSIPLMPIKGVSLSGDHRFALYPRFYEDVDVLLERKHAERLITYIMSQGFVACGGLTASQALLCLDSLCSLNFRSPKAVCSIDLHLNAMTRGFPGSLTLAALTSARREQGVYSSSMDWQLVYQQALLIVSCFKNDWQRIDKVIDVGLVEAALTDKEQGAVRELMREWGYTRIYGVTFQLLDRIRNFGHSELPGMPYLKDKVHRGDDRILVENIVAGWFNVPLRTAASSRSRMPRTAFLDRKSARAFYIFAHLIYPTQNDFRRAPFQGIHLAPYALVRLLRGVLILARGFQARVSSALRGHRFLKGLCK